MTTVGGDSALKKLKTVSYDSGAGWTLDGNPVQGSEVAGILNDVIKGTSRNRDGTIPLNEIGGKPDVALANKFRDTANMLGLSAVFTGGTGNIELPHGFEDALERRAQQQAAPAPEVAADTPAAGDIPGAGGHGVRSWISRHRPGGQRSR